MDLSKQNRKVASTKCNDVSSWSHSIFELKLQGTHSTLQGGQTFEGALVLVDLAGSERLDKSGVEGDRLKETKSINSSLSALRLCIQKMSNKGKHIPYWDSKLTTVLQPHLTSDSAKILMIVNVSPLGSNVNETINSLRFAA